MKLVRTTALLASIAVGATLAGTLTRTAEASTGPDWGPCPEDAAVQCATVTVPVDWSRPGGDTITVAIARRPAVRPIGTLLLMPGGPGGSGVDQVLGREPVPPEVAARFDVVSFDPRGTNRSSPVLCDAGLVANPPEANPEAGATFAALAAYSRELGRSCREHTGALVDHVDSVSVARDIDAIRAALGERRLSLYGRSYGTLAGQMYAERFPGRVRALVLDSVFDHSLTAERFLMTEAAAGEDAFAEFASWCATSPSCAVPDRDARAAFDGLYRRAVAGELPVGSMDLVSQMLSFFYGPSWPAAAEFLSSPAAEFRASPGEVLSSPSRILRSPNEVLDSPTGEVPGSPDETLGSPGVRASAAVVPFPIASFCADHRVRISSEREWRAMWARQQRPAPTMRTHFAWLPVSLCAVWPAKVANPQHRPQVHGTPPILVLNSRHDPATPLTWASNVADQLPRTTLLTYDGWGHGVLDRSTCTRMATSRYLIDLRPPRPGTHCPAVPPGPPTTSPLTTQAAW